MELSEILKLVLVPLLTGLAAQIIPPLRRAKLATRLALFAAVAIAAGAAILIADRHHEQSKSVSGTVVDGGTNSAIPGAEISIAGRPELAYSESNGNFKIDVGGAGEEAVRLRVTKTGYQTYDRSVPVPTEGVIVPLQRF